MDKTATEVVLQLVARGMKKEADDRGFGNLGGGKRYQERVAKNLGLDPNRRATMDSIVELAKANGYRKGPIKRIKPDPYADDRKILNYIRSTSLFGNMSPLAAWHAATSDMRHNIKEKGWKGILSEGRLTKEIQKDMFKPTFMNFGR